MRNRQGESVAQWDEEDQDLPWPTEQQYEEFLGFTSDGEIYVRRDKVLDDSTRRALKLALDGRQDVNRKRPAILNLNHPSLVAARRAALDSERTKLQKVFEGKTATKEARSERAAQMLAERAFPPFVSIRVAWLRASIGKGR